MSFRNRTVLITGASRGIGRCIAERFAREGANLVLCGRSMREPAHTKLSGTMRETQLGAEEMGASVLSVQMDLCSSDSVRDSVQRAVSRFGGVDLLVNNSSAIHFVKSADMKQFDLMHSVNARGTYSMIRECLPHLVESKGRILSISPPIHTLSREWLLPHSAYTMSKYGMTMATLGASDSVCANTLWPSRLISTAATRMLEERTSVPGFSKGRSPLLFGEAAYRIATSPPETGRCFLDEEVVRYDEDDAPIDIFL